MIAGSPVQAVTFSPDLVSDDPIANYWLSQVTIRLRREIFWHWHEREGLSPQAVDQPPRVILRIAGR